MIILWTHSSDSGAGIGIKQMFSQAVLQQISLGVRALCSCYVGGQPEHAKPCFIYSLQVKTNSQLVYLSTALPDGRDAEVYSVCLCVGLHGLVLAS